MLRPGAGYGAEVPRRGVFPVPDPGRDVAGTKYNGGLLRHKYNVFIKI
jgi:hypothetical protein